MSKVATECIIVGAGPVGLTLACQLHQYGVPFRIIDELEGPVLRTKAAAIWSRTAEFLEQMGLVEEFKAAGLHCYGASFFSEGKRVAHLTLDSIDSLYNYVMMIPQHVTERILREHLEHNKAPVEYGKKLVALSQEADSVTIELASGESLCSRWVVGCDGAHSGVRHAVGLSFEGEKLESKWIVADLYLNGVPLDDEILLCLHEEGPTALFPLGDSFFRMVAETGATLEPSNQDLAVSAAEHIANTRIPGENLKVLKIESAGYFTINERQVEHYKKGRVFLAGDAAHVHSPLGGQGMNTGMHDANNLAWKLAMVTQGWAKESLLETYHEERYPVGKRLVQATSRGTKLITSRRPIASTLRKQAARFLGNLPPIQNKVRNTLSEIEINYRGRSLSQEPSNLGPGWRFHRGTRAGERAPDASILRNREEVRLATLMRGCQFQLLLFGDRSGDCWPRLSSLAREVEKRFKALVKVHFIGTESDPPGDIRSAYVFDHNEELHHLYGASQACFYLIRPDGYIACRNQSLELRDVISYLDRWCLDREATVS